MAASFPSAPDVRSTRSPSSFTSTVPRVSLLAPSSERGQPARSAPLASSTSAQSREVPYGDSMITSSYRSRVPRAGVLRLHRLTWPAGSRQRESLSRHVDVVAGGQLVDAERAAGEGHHLRVGSQRGDGAAHPLGGPGAGEGEVRRIHPHGRG